MARQARAVSSKGLYFIELKGEVLFLSQKDKDMFMSTAKQCFRDGGKIYGIELSDNAAYMVVKESKKGISGDMKSLKVIYARYFNKENGREGKVFSDRFKSLPYESLKEAQNAALTLKNADLLKKPSVKTSSGSSKKTAAVKKAVVKPVKKETINSAEKTENSKTVTSEKPKRQNRSLPSWLL